MNRMLLRIRNGREGGGHLVAGAIVAVVVDVDQKQGRSVLELQTATPQRPLVIS